MKRFNHDDLTMEILSNFIWVHFPEHRIIQAETLATLLMDLMEDSPKAIPMLVDLSAIDGFSIEAFELLLSLITHCEQNVAILATPDQISQKYAQLVEISVDNGHTKAFNNLTSAKSWLLKPTYH